MFIITISTNRVISMFNLMLIITVFVYQLYVWYLSNDFWQRHKVNLKLPEYVKLEFLVLVVERAHMLQTWRKYMRKQRCARWKSNMDNTQKKPNDDLKKVTPVNCGGCMSMLCINA